MAKAKKEGAEVEFVEELPQDGRMKYPSILEGNRKASTGSKAGKWAKLTDFDNGPSARDKSNRLRKEHPAFEFTTRSFVDGNENKTRVYARFIGASGITDE